MFARHTQTRMKASAVVNGFKSWASKIHDQLPLTPKESQRLLTALTGSFRKHLDEVHPKSASENVRPKGTSPASTSKIDKHPMSSASLADRHLAYVLTSPLLARSTSTKTRAPKPALTEAEFANTKDPVSLLESYEKYELITTAAAELCATRLKHVIQRLDPDVQAKTVKQGRYGTRLLACFWRANLYESAEFVDQHRLRDGLVWSVMLEGRDDLLWEWLKMDLRLQPRDQPGGSVGRWAHVGRVSAAGKAFDDYRWKGRLLRGMVEAGFGPPNSGKQCADVALSVYLKARQMRLDVNEHGEHMKWLPLEPARQLIVNKMSYVGRLWRHTSPGLYEAMIDSFGGTQNAMLERHRADLWLKHPTKPTAEPLYKLMRDIYSDNTSLILAANVRDMLEKTRTNGETVRVYRLLLLAYLRLRAQDEGDKAEWMRAFALQHYPSMRKHTQEITEELMELEEIEMPSGHDGKPAQKDNEQEMVDGVPFLSPQFL